jgi:hypothetical protein
VKKLQGMNISELENMASMPGISEVLARYSRQVLKDRMQEADGAGVAGGDASAYATKLLGKAKARKAANNAVNSDSDSD